METKSLDKLNMPHGPVYCSSVLIGNWSEDVALEEDLLKVFIEKREHGELLSQRVDKLMKAALKKLQLSCSRDGNVHFGDVIMIMNPQPREETRPAYAFCVTFGQDAIHHVQEEICNISMDVAGSALNHEPNARSAFVIRACDGSHDGEPLRYGQPFYLCTADGRLFLHSDRATFVVFSKKAHHNKVTFTNVPSHLCEWKILPFNPLFRMELEYTPVVANSRVIITHIKTNKNLRLEEQVITTLFGKELECAVETSLDSHKAETDRNHWMLMMPVPGDEIMPVDDPRDDPYKCATAPGPC